jgi:hypothetical protein
MKILILLFILIGCVSPPRKPHVKKLHVSEITTHFNLYVEGETRLFKIVAQGYLGVYQPERYALGYNNGDLDSFVTLDGNFYVVGKSKNAYFQKVTKLDSVWR